MEGRDRKHRRKKRRLPIILVLLMCAGIFIYMEAGAKKQFPDFFAFKKEVIEAVKVKVSPEAKLPFEKVRIPEDDVSGGYYYQQLSHKEQELYKELYQGLMDTSASIYMHSADIGVLKKVSQFIFCDRPELFWCTGEMEVISHSDYSQVKPAYAYTGAEKEQMQAELERAAASCFSGITEDMGEYDKVKYIFEYLVNTVDYNKEVPDNQNIYSALIGRASVCAGYSRSAQYLLQRQGVECIYVTGTIPNQGAHAWNIVKCNGQYYDMDVTFGDPIFIETEGGGSPPRHSINYDYLCCSDSELMKNHTADTIVEFPQCTSKDLNYYRLNGMYYEEFNPDQILQAMNDTIYNKKGSFTCKFANDILYQEAHDPVLNDIVKKAAQNLLEYYGLESVQYTYMEDPLMDKITIYWE